MCLNDDVLGIICTMLTEDDGITHLYSVVDGGEPCTEEEEVDSKTSVGKWTKMAPVLA